MLTRDTIRREATKLDRLLKTGLRVLSERDRDIAYGARQALLWVLKDNAMRPSKVVTAVPPKPKGG